MAKTFVGIVSSDKPAKTVIVTVQSRKTHPLYHKQYLSTKHFAVHDEKSEAKKGDRVLIEEVRPLSATKRFLLKQVIERPVLSESDVKTVTDTEVEE